MAARKQPKSTVAPKRKRTVKPAEPSPTVQQPQNVVTRDVRADGFRQK